MPYLTYYLGRRCRALWPVVLEWCQREYKAATAARGRATSRALCCMGPGSWGSR